MRPRLRHGTLERYDAGCRCDDCGDARWWWELDLKTLFESDRDRVDEVRPSPRYL